MWFSAETKITLSSTFETVEQVQMLKINVISGWTENHIDFQHLNLFNMFNVDHIDFNGIHPLLSGLLMSVYLDPNQMRRVWSHNWVRCWKGLHEACAHNEGAMISAEESQLAEDLTRLLDASIEVNTLRMLQKQARDCRLTAWNLIKWW